MKAYQILCFVCKPVGLISKPVVFIGKDRVKVEAAFNRWKKINPDGKIEEILVEVVE
jgi:hypothetical protein